MMERGRGERDKGIDEEEVVTLVSTSSNVGSLKRTIRLLAEWHHLTLELLGPGSIHFNFDYRVVFFSHALVIIGLP